jgi:hypothetical protein
VSKWARGIAVELALLVAGSLVMWLLHPVAGAAIMVIAFAHQSMRHNEDA